jgi:hypothetical protein
MLKDTSTTDRQTTHAAAPAPRFPLPLAHSARTAYPPHHTERQHLAWSPAYHINTSPWNESRDDIVVFISFSG